MMRNHLTSLFLSLISGSSSDPIRLSLEAASAKWFRGVWISGLVVALGCMFEIWEVTFDLRNWWRHRKNQGLAPENPGSWMYPMAALGLFLVVGGITAETVFEVLDANIESQIRSHESERVSRAESEAASSAERTATLENENLKLRLQIAQVGNRADMLLNKQSELADSIKRFAGQKFEMGYDPELRNDWELYTFKAVLWSTLKTKAHWTNEPDRDIYVASAGIGIFVRSTAPPRTKEAARELAHSLDAILGRIEIGNITGYQVGLAVTVRPKPPAVIGEESSAEDTVLVYVGPHP